jgi:MFS family permease
VNALRAYRGLLSNGPLSRLLGGEFVSGIGDWLYLVALLIVVYEHSQDTLLLGIVGAARVLPYVLLSVPAGVAADRYDRRLILILTDTARAVIMVAIAWLVATNGPIEAIIALAVLATCFSTFFGPTIGAYLPTLVRDERELGPANSAWASLDSLGFVVGPVLAGLLVAAGGLTIAFILNAVSFAVVDVILWRLPSSVGGVTRAAETPAPDAAAAGGRPNAADGFASPDSTVAPDSAAAPAPDAVPAPDVPGGTTRILIGLATIDTVGSFVFGGVGVLTVYLATTTYGAGDAGTGYLNSALGIGGLIGALVSGALVLRPRLAPVMIVGAVAAAGGLAALGVVGSLGPAIVALTIASAGSLVLEVISTTIFQRAVPDRIRGRALGSIATVSSLAFCVGSFLLPVLADAFGVLPVLVAGGIGVGAGAAVGLVLVGRATSRAASPYDATFTRVAALPIFAGVSPARLEAAIQHINPRPMTAGEVVIREGDVADRFYVIERGRVRVTQGAGWLGGEQMLRDMGPDEVFGEIGLLRSSPRTATVTALEDGLLLALDRDNFLALVAADTRLGTRLLDLHRGSVVPELRAERAAVSAS